MARRPRALERSSAPALEVSRLYRPTDYQRRISVSEKSGDKRSPFRRDWARLTHSTSFRRLQGKTQLFPSDENDFFRNRLTHSLEVAQIATGIAADLNGREAFLENNRIDIDLVNFAALAHDLGHPPFGHNGEKALDALMRDQGGFEGNAQTLRIVARLEKKETVDFPSTSSTPTLFSERNDLRIGLNLTLRALASILKYDEVIPHSRDNPKLRKGYYASEEELVSQIKEAVTGNRQCTPFRTLECAIMDLADDIAYSTYDLEDSFKAGFLSPISMMSLDNGRKKEISDAVNEKMEEEYGPMPRERQITPENMHEIFLYVFEKIYQPTQSDLSDRTAEEIAVINSTQVYSRSSELCDDGYLRAEFTSKLVNLLMQGVEFFQNREIPALSTVKFDLRTFRIVEVLKRVAFTTIIDSNRLKMAEHRGTEIIKQIFEALIKPEQGKKLLPKDWRVIYECSEFRHRAVCDFIAGMTDRYCIEFYSRLVGINAPSIQKPY
jgi:dGTPase